MSNKELESTEVNAVEVETTTNNESANEVTASEDKGINSEFKLGQTLELSNNGGKLVILSIERANGSGQVLYTAEINGVLSVYKQKTRSNNVGDVRKYRATEIKELCGIELNKRASNGESKTRKEYEKIEDSLIIRPLKREFISKVRENVIVNIECANKAIQDNENKIAELTAQNERLSAQINEAENWLNSTTAEEYEREQNAIFDELEAEAEANRKENIAKRTAEKAMCNLSLKQQLELTIATMKASNMDESVIATLEAQLQAMA